MRLDSDFVAVAGSRVVWAAILGMLDQDSAEWAAGNSLVLFDDEVPTEEARIDAGGQIVRTSLIDGGDWHGAGSPSNMNGRAISRNRALVWEVFQLNAALVQCDLTSRPCEILESVSSLVFAIDTLERPGGAGLMATGGDDGAVRIWRLSDFSLVREFRGSPGVPQGVALMKDGRRVIFSYSARQGPTEIFAGDISSGQSVSLLRIPEPFVKVVPAGDGFVYGAGQRLVLADAATGKTQREFALASTVERFSVSRNGEWLAAADDKGILYCFEVKTGRLAARSPEAIESLTSIAVANDGSSVWTTEFLARLKRWDTKAGTIKTLTEVRGQTKALSLSADEKRLAVGGNHRDIAVFDAKSGDEVVSFTTSAADFYVTNAWLSGKRLVFTTDAGVLFSGTLER